MLMDVKSLVSLVVLGLVALATGLVLLLAY
jgi:hypothetical protein